MKFLTDKDCLLSSSRTIEKKWRKRGREGRREGIKEVEKGGRLVTFSKQFLSIYM